jgi:hypothetical protein
MFIFPLNKLGPGKVAHFCNPSYQKVEMGKTAVQSQPGQKVSKSLSQQNKHDGPLL